MNHLSSQQISECLTGAAAPEHVAHTRDCGACRAELERLETALQRFRSSVRQWSAEPEVFQTTYRLARGNVAVAGLESARAPCRRAHAATAVRPGFDGAHTRGSLV